MDKLGTHCLILSSQGGGSLVGLKPLTCGVCADWVVRVRTEFDCIKLLITNVRRELENCLVWEKTAHLMSEVLDISREGNKFFP